MRDPVRVLVVDDSALMRKLIPQALERDGSIRVVGTAMNGAFGMKKVEELDPQVVTLDLEMPRMDGLEMLRQIMRTRRRPVIVVSAHTTEGAAATFRALSLGALDFVTKPQDPAAIEEMADELIRKIRAVAQARLQHTPPLEEPVARPRKPARDKQARPSKIIVMAASTGGPHALQYVLAQLPGDFSGSLLVVQHMPEGFTEMFARRLNDCCALEVKEAQSGDLLLPGRALIAPGNRHIRVRRMPLGDVVVLSDEDKVNGHRPSADVLLHSVAELFGVNAIAVLLTGMGEDGAEGMAEVKAAGGYTLAQNEASCVVYGMPRAAIERGYAARIVTLENMARVLGAHTVAEEAPRRPLKTGS